MATDEYELAAAPKEDRKRELWLQHCAGFILFEDVRQYAVENLDQDLSTEAREAALKSIDDSVYGLMMVLDGVTGALTNSTHRVDLQVIARLSPVGNVGGDEVISKVDLFHGDGMCMGYHGWREGDFGSAPIATRRDA